MRWILCLLIVLYGAACSGGSESSGDPGSLTDPGDVPVNDPGSPADLHPELEPDGASNPDLGMSTDALLPLEACAFSDPTGMEKFLNVAYADLHDLQLIDIRTPKGKDGPFPVLIWIHGGAWKQGSKNVVPTWLQQIAAGDYAIASIDYRFSDNDWPASAADARASIRWLRAHASDYNLNPDQFGVLGSSAGGHLSGLVAVSADAVVLNGEEALGNWEVSGAVQAAVPFYGAHDFANLDPDRALSNCADDKEMVHDEVGSPETLLLDCAPSYSNCPALAAEASPISYVDASDPPTFLVHGLEDCTIAPNQSVRMAEALHTLGVPTYLALVPDAGHNSSQCAEFGQLMVPLRAFFDRYLRSCDSTHVFAEYAFESDSE